MLPSPIIHEEYYRKGLCYSCWEKEKLEEIRKKWLKVIGGAKIVDVVPVDNPYTSDELYEIIFEKNDNRYKLELQCYDDDCFLRVYDLTKKKYVDVREY